MEMIVLGLSHKTAPIELRERVTVSDVELDKLLARFQATHTVLESVVLSTCNRTEIYAVVSSRHAGEDYFASVLAARSGLPRQELQRHLYSYAGNQAVSHLMQVVSGLDSLVVGETQILGQVRNAFLVAEDAGATGMFLNQVFRRAIQLGKRVQSDTDIGQGAVSISYAAVQLAKKIYGNLGHCRAMVLGAGKMGRLTAQHLQSAGVSQIWIANRTLANAESLAELVGGQVVSWDSFTEVLPQIDLLISATSTSEPVLHAASMQEVLTRRQGKQTPVTLIDIGLPRNLDPDLGSVRQAFLYDIDDLEGVVDANLQERERQAKEVRRMVDEAVSGFAHWVSEQEVVPVVAAIREKGQRIQQSVMESLEHKMPELTEHQRKLIQKHTMSIVNQLLRDPIANIKELAVASGGVEHVRVFAELFGVSPEDLRGHAWPTDDVQRLSSDLSFVDVVRRWTEQLLYAERGIRVDADPVGSSL